MPISFDRLPVIAEGKTKIIYANPDNPKTVYMRFKDDITAGDGVKHDVIAGKALVDWKTNRDIFGYLNRRGVRTHYLETPEEKVALVEKLDRKINLEVVTRRVAAGSILKWGDVDEGTRFDPLITQFHYKDDPLHDPMLDPGYIDYIVRSKGAKEFMTMREINGQVFTILEEAFARFAVQLVDMKLEYGIIGDEVVLIDEITGGSFRLWPYAKEKVDLQQGNVLNELDPAGRLDKDTYRMGESGGQVLTKFEQIAEITARFAEL
ncbi:phosphoribosylaminoimidazolesuccinocarboxamide synthase [candidate division KSB1 bacterium]|nr:phosphoribosylaminoimidazolesuccinocarboxamide synthase [candidate division KSB1 bacterium]